MAQFHGFAPQKTDGNPLLLSCEKCGKALWHEEHWGGDRAKAKEAFDMIGRGVDPTLPAPPRFSSVEEADAWLEERAKQLPGYKEPLIFATQEEADDWLRQQAGEPYVPEGWITEEQVYRGIFTKDAVRKFFDPNAFKPGALTQETLNAAIEEVRGPKILMDTDEYGDFRRNTERAIRAEQLMQMGMITPEQITKGFSVD